MLLYNVVVIFVQKMLPAFQALLSLLNSTFLWSCFLVVQFNVWVAGYKRKKNTETPLKRNLFRTEYFPIVLFFDTYLEQLETAAKNLCGLHKSWVVYHKLLVVFAQKSVWWLCKNLSQTKYPTYAVMQFCEQESTKRNWYCRNQDGKHL